MKEVTEITTVQITVIKKFPDEVADSVIECGLKNRNAIEKVTKDLVFPDCDDVKVLSDQYFVQDVKEAEE